MPKFEADDKCLEDLFKKFSNEGNLKNFFKYFPKTRMSIVALELCVERRIHQTEIQRAILKKFNI